MLLFKLFFAFIQIGLFSVGGGYAAIPLIQEQIVNIYKLMSLEEFSDLITIAEMTPGPISINSSTFVGIKLAGFFGAIICTLGCIIPSFIICLTLAHFYYKYRTLKVLNSLRPAVVALIGSAGVSILMLALFQADFSSFQFKDFHIIEFGLFIISLFLLRKYKEKISILSIIFGTGILGTIIYIMKDFLIC